jgi:N-acyl-D-amino-acid deacylase
MGTLALVSPVLAEDRPLSGTKVAAFEPLDKVILEFMDRIECQACTVAISRDGKLVYVRGYGWSDQDKKKPVATDAIMRLGNVTKAFTAAAVYNAIADKKLTLDTKAFDYIGIKPPEGKMVEPQLAKVTVGHLLEHKGGWDKAETFDPFDRLDKIDKELKPGRRLTSKDIISYMTTQPLQLEPGKKMVPSNFGYCVLGRVLEKATGKPYADALEQSVCRPLKINKDILPGLIDPAKRNAREVWFPIAASAIALDIADADDGLLGTAPALATFLQAYWITGEARKPNQTGQWYIYGGAPGSMALGRQREDGLNVAVLLNNQREKHFGDDAETLRRNVDEVLDAIFKKK